LSDIIEEIVLQVGYLPESLIATWHIVLYLFCILQTMTNFQISEAHFWWAVLGIYLWSCY